MNEKATGETSLDNCTRRSYWIYNLFVGLSPGVRLLNTQLLDYIVKRAISGEFTRSKHCYSSIQL